MAGTAIKRRLKRVADFFIFEVQSRLSRFRFPVYHYIRCGSEYENCNSSSGESMDLVTLAKFLFTASVIVFSSWLSQKRPDLAGFIIALPLASLLALALAHLQHGDAEKSIAFGQSILLAVPVSYLFFIPFFIPKVAEFGFWLVYGLGLSLLVVGFFLHQALLKWFG